MSVTGGPPAHSALPSQTELGLLARVSELFNGIRQEATAKLGALHAEVIGKREALTAERYETRIRRIESGMRAMLNKHGGELEQRVFDALKAKREYAYFNYENKRQPTRSSTNGSSSCSSWSCRW
jgi:hypothetical protein